MIFLMKCYDMSGQTGQSESNIFMLSINIFNFDKREVNTFNYQEKRVIALKK